LLPPQELPVSPTVGALSRRVEPCLSMISTEHRYPLFRIML
jgi:hypothetical protein